MCKSKWRRIKENDICIPTGVYNKVPENNCNKMLIFKEVFHSVQGSNQSLTDQLSSVNSRNEYLQLEVNSERKCIRRLEDEKQMLTKVLENVKDYNQKLQQQIGQINMTREGKTFTDVSQLKKCSILLICTLFI